MENTKKTTKKKTVSENIKEKKPLKLSTSLEDYLEAIYIISTNEKTEYVRITDISNRLKKSKPSVNTSINVLSKNGYLEHEHYGGVVLTKKGLELAKEIFSRHNIIKKFFVDIVGIEPEPAETEACCIEHIMSDASMKKFADYIQLVLKNKVEQ